MTKRNRAFKGVWIPKEIYLDDRLTWSEKILLVEIDSLDQGKGCFASNGYLSDFIGVNKTTISTAISKLCRIGYLERVGGVSGSRRYIFSKCKGYSKNSQGSVVENQKHNNTDTNTSNNKNSNSGLFKSFVERYNDFCLKEIGIGCKMNGMEGNHLKQIIAYLKSQVHQKDDVSVLTAWEFILNSWDKLDDFHRKQMKLSQINSNMINILNQLRNGKDKHESSLERLKAEIANRNR